MTFLIILHVINYCLVLVYGLFLSAHISLGGSMDKRQKKLLFLLYPLFLLIQTPSGLILGVDVTQQLYPLIVHLPLILILILALKRPVGVSLVSVCTAYLCCQLPRWVDLTVIAITHSNLIGEISYTLVIFPIFLLLRRYFVRPAYSAMAVSPQSMLLFGSLPIAYYVFDYATVIYSDALSRGIQALNEFLPTALILFYVMFLSAYHKQMQIHSDADLQRTMLEAELKQAELEVKSLRNTETQIAIYQHDMRHHLTAIDGFLAANQVELAKNYIRKVQTDVDSITPAHFCENELVNLLCSSFVHKADATGIQLTVDASLPNNLSIPDTELCSLLSNGLENALHAVNKLEKTNRWITLYCGIRLNKLLIEIKNPYTCPITIEDGLPVSNQEGHGYGCRSIRSITDRNRGLCNFEPQDGIFTLRVMLPL